MEPRQMMNKYDQMAEGAEALMAPEVEKLLRAAVAEEIERMAPDLIAQLEAARAENSQRAALVEDIETNAAVRTLHEPHDYTRQRALELACGGYEGGTEQPVADILDRANAYYIFMMGRMNFPVLSMESREMQAAVTGFPTTDGQTPDPWPTPGNGTDDPDENNGLGDSFTDRPDR